MRAIFAHFNPTNFWPIPREMRLAQIIVFFACGLGWGSSLANGQEVKSVLVRPIETIEKTPQKNQPNTNAIEQQPEVRDAGEDIDQLLTNLVLGHIPHHFVEDKDWGKQDRRWDGVKFRRKGLQIKTKRRKKLVNHGTWKKYEVSLIDPENQFSISVKNMREIDGEKLAFDIYFGANLKIKGRQAKWVKGVKLYSISVSGQAKVQLQVTIELKTRLDFTKLPPDLIFQPTATAADLTLEEFRIDRIGNVGGEVAQQATRLARDVIEDKIAKKEEKLLNKINKQFEKKKEKLRLSIHDAIDSKWTASAKAFLPDDVSQAIDASEK